MLLWRMCLYVLFIWFVLIILIIGVMLCLVVKLSIFCVLWMLFISELVMLWCFVISENMLYWSGLVGVLMLISVLFMWSNDKYWFMFRLVDIVFKIRLKWFVNLVNVVLLFVVK